MPEYVSTFIAGFEEIVPRQIARDIKGVRVIDICSGFLRFEYAGNFKDISRLPYLNNTFYVISAFSGGSISFEKMAVKASKTRFRPLSQSGSFRVRFSKENQFVRAPKTITDLAENTIRGNCGLTVNRLNPSTEFWFIIRSEGIGFFGQLLKKRNISEKAMHKGELRPELAYLLCCCRTVAPTSVICDPFAGYGSIPIQIQKHFKFKKMYVNDFDEERAAYLKKTSLGQSGGIIITRLDASNMKHIADSSVDLIISDPPWGFYNHFNDIADFYRPALKEFKRIIAGSGKVVLLTGAPAGLIEASSGCSLFVSSNFSILVNGKKASVITLENSRGSI